MKYSRHANSEPIEDHRQNNGINTQHTLDWMELSGQQKPMESTAVVSYYKILFAIKLLRNTEQTELLSWPQGKV